MTLHSKPAAGHITEWPAYRGPWRCVAHAAEQTAASTSNEVDVLKGRLYGMVGSKGGLDMSRADKGAVVEFLQQFSGKGRPDPEGMPLTGTSWELLFTESESAWFTDTIPAFRPDNVTDW